MSGFYVLFISASLQKHDSPHEKVPLEKVLYLIYRSMTLMCLTSKFAFNTSSAQKDSVSLELTKYCGTLLLAALEPLASL